MDLKETVEKELSSDTIISLFDDVKEKKLLFNNKIMGLCSFHEETNASFNFDPNNMGIYKCFGCGETGNIYTYLKKAKQIEKPLIYLAEYLKIDTSGKEYTDTEPKPDYIEEIEIKLNNEVKKPKEIKFSSDYFDEKEKIIEDSIIIKAKTNLFIKNKDKLRVLEEMGISYETAKAYNLGYEDGRFWIPIKDEENKFVNIRKYDPFNKDGNKFLSYKQGYGEDRIFPIKNIKDDTIFIFEGEKDTLIALSNDINAITNTAGAGSWNNNWNEKFLGKSIIICMDIDEPGVKGALKRAELLSEYAAQIKIIDLPLDITKYPNGDFADYTKEYSISSFLKLVSDTKAFTLDKSENEFNLILSEASKNKYINAQCNISNVICAGKDSSPFGVPSDFNAKCDNPNQDSKNCLLCPLLGGELNKVFERNNPVISSLIKIKTDQVISALKKYLGILPRCSFAKFDFKRYYNVECVRLVPDITYNIEEDFEHVYRTGYYVLDEGAFIKTNKSYNVKAITILDPNNQYIVHQIFNLQESSSGIDNFKLDAQMITRLKTFQIKTTIEDKLNDIYSEFSKVSRIYGKDDIYFLMDLSFHSALTFNFQGKNIGKGWVETAIIGDSGVGKTTQAKFLTKHYKAGEFISGESANYTGLMGGLSQQGGVWQLQWGRLPLNDKKLCIIDETTGLKEEEIAKLSEIRSSGEAKIQKIVTESTRSRTRIIWLANPRKANLGIKNYSYGIFTVKEVFGMPEDVRRLDFAYISVSGDVSEEIINKEPDFIIPKYDSDLCHDLVMFAWSRKSDDIIITPEAEKLTLEHSIILGRTYHSSIPLVEPADIRNKIIRGAVSLAIRLFSVNEELKVLVKPEHVDFIVKTINRLYSNKTFGYLDYSNAEFEKTRLIDPDEVINILSLHDKFNVRDLLSNSTISRNSLQDLVESNILIDNARQEIRTLRRHNAIKEYNNFYVLQPGLLTLLRMLRDHYDKGGTINNFGSKEKTFVKEGVILD